MCFATASLEGNIAINFYTLLSDAVAADSAAYMLFAMADGTVIKVMLSQAVCGEVNDEIYYMFTCEVNARQMADEARCQFLYEGGSTSEVTYSVKAYCNYILNNLEDADSKTLVQAMLNYGAASQLHFDYNTGNLPNSEIATPDYSDVVIEGYNLDEDVTVVINGDTEVTFNLMAYCQGVQNDTSGAFDAEMKDLVAALYLYNQAANNYFKEN